MPKIIVAMLMILLSACAPTIPAQQFPMDCPIEKTAGDVVTGHWLNGDQVWRLRQSALLELGAKKIALEGFLRLDLSQRNARLLAMNEMGLVLFDLQLDEEGQVLNRAIPQLQQIAGFDLGIARSLRQIFLLPRPKTEDHAEAGDQRQNLRRILPDGDLRFSFDCRGDLRTTRLQTETHDWRVIYEQYQDFDGQRLPQLIVLNDKRYRLKLTLWMREVRQEP